MMCVCIISSNNHMLTAYVTSDSKNLSSSCFVRGSTYVGHHWCFTLTKTVISCKMIFVMCSVHGVIDPGLWKH